MKCKFGCVCCPVCEKYHTPPAISRFRIGYDDARTRTTKCNSTGCFDWILEGNPWPGGYIYAWVNSMNLGLWILDESARTTRFNF